MLLKQFLKMILNIQMCVPGVGMCTCVRVLDPLELEVQEEVVST